jgi:GNAT superfamily N-acetyltransferase
MTGYIIRPFERSDAATIGRQRAGMFHAMGQLDEVEMPRMAALTEPFVQALFDQAAFLGFAASSELAPNHPVGGAGVWLLPLWPNPMAGRSTDAAIQGLVLNVFVHPDHRRRGLARALMLALESACAERGVARLFLHASPDGRALYESLGYAPTNEMRLQGPPQRRRFDPA